MSVSHRNYYSHQPPHPFKVGDRVVFAKEYINDVLDCSTGYQIGVVTHVRQTPHEPMTITKASGDIYEVSKFGGTWNARCFDTYIAPSALPEELFTL